MTTQAELDAPGPDSTQEPGPRAATTGENPGADCADFADFYHRTYTTYLAYACRYTTSRDGAQDIVHDTFTDLYARWNTIRQPTSYGVRALRHKLQDQARNSARTIPTSTFEESALAENAPVETVVLRRTLLDALRTLPPTRRRIVVAYYIQDLTTDEIATCLGITPSTVRAHLVHARRDLRDLLTDPPTPRAGTFEEPPARPPSDTGTLTPAVGPAYDRYVDTVYRYIALLTGTGSAAEDLTSKTFRYALTHHTATDDDPKTWLIATARTFVAGRPAAVPGPRGDRHDAVTALRDAAAQEPAAKATVNIDTLLKAFNSLNPAQYECIVLRFFQGLSVAESAHIMNRSENALKVLQHRALKGLAQHFEPDVRPHSEPLQPADITLALNAVVAPRCSHYIKLNSATQQRMRAAIKRRSGEELIR
ncbi:sigma-70 family RNA polymerase sigma factor [Streptomyces sp. KL116D]|uniref:sigma-70 family RNA polymerase sigma factor n=1 Tax=Streptomyces sp. KL116D TaxID=3045152 RepID=UPI003557CCE2